MGSVSAEAVNPVARGKLQQKHSASLDNAPAFLLTRCSPEVWVPGEERESLRWPGELQLPLILQGQGFKSESHLCPNPFKLFKK